MLINVCIEYFNKLVEYFPDVERIYIECTDVFARNIDPERGINIGFIWIEAEHNRRTLTVKVVTDEEETWVDDIPYLEKRHEQAEYD